MSKNDNQHSDNAQFITFLREVISETLPPSTDNNDRISQIIGSVVSVWGGTTVYIHKTDHQKINDRNNALMARFNGNNRREVCREFGISEVLFYSIIKKANAEKQGANHEP